MPPIPAASARSPHSAPRGQGQGRKAYAAGWIGGLPTPRLAYANTRHRREGSGLSPTLTLQCGWVSCMFPRSYLPPCAPGTIRSTWHSAGSSGSVRRHRPHAPPCASRSCRRIAGLRYQGRPLPPALRARATCSRTQALQYRFPSRLRPSCSARACPFGQCVAVPRGAACARPPVRRASRSRLQALQYLFPSRLRPSCSARACPFAQCVAVPRGAVCARPPVRRASRSRLQALQ